jgi:hypothetical protein
MVAVTGVVPAFTPLKAAMFPFPEAPNPMDGLLFVQAKEVPVTGPPKFTAVVGAPLHTVWLGTAFTVGVGFTVMVNDVGVPGHPLAMGVTVMVAVMGADVALVALKEAIFPIPEAPKPMAGLLLVQLYKVPATAPPKFTAVVGDPAHTVWLPTAFTVGVGVTVMVNARGVPGHPLAVGVTVMVAVTGVAPAFTPLKAAMFPLPEAPKPMDGLLFVQAKDVPVMGPPKFTAVTGAPLHTVWLGTAFTVGVGFTVMVNEVGVPVQPAAVGVTVMVAVMGADVALAAVNERMFPLPEAPRPMAGLLLVQL